jgi:hypothetical protein
MISRIFFFFPLILSFNSCFANENIQLVKNCGNDPNNNVPWKVAIYNEDDYICSGTLISEDLILTG